MPPTLSAEAIRKMVSYYYLLSYCPPPKFAELAEASQPMRARLAEQHGLTLDEFMTAAASEAAFRISAFHAATRLPDQELVAEIGNAVLGVNGNLEEMESFLAAMVMITTAPGRAKKDNRLHRQKGCAFCTMPCRYGFLTLMIEPDFKQLLAMLDAENKKLAEGRDPARVLWTYTAQQIWNLLEREDGCISPVHLGNLSYCLLLLGTAKSRFALPEKELQAYQRLNQARIQQLGAAPIRLVPA